MRLAILSIDRFARNLTPVRCCLCGAPAGWAGVEDVHDGRRSDITKHSFGASMWNERYGGPGYAYGTAPNDFLAAVAAEIPLGRVLALADGEGRNGVHLATLGHVVTSVDASSVGLGKARALAGARGVPLETIVADLAEFEIQPGAWEGIVSIFCHLPPALRRRVHAQVVRGLAPGGLFILEAYTPDQLRHGTGGPSDAQLMPTLALLREELAGLELIHAVEMERDVHEGAFHDGRSAVVQLIGRAPVVVAG